MDNFLKRFGGSTVKKGKGTWVDAKSLLRTGIGQQRAMLEGKDVFVRKTKVKSWFAHVGQFSPIVAGISLFGTEKAVPIGDTSPEDVLNFFEEDLASGDFDEVLKKIDASRREKGEKLRKAQNNG